MDARPSMDAPMDAFRLPATVSVEGVDPVETSVFWLGPQPREVPDGIGSSRTEMLDVLVFRKSEVPTVPVGTVVTCPYMNGLDVENWVVAGDWLAGADEHRRIMKRRREA